MGCRIWCSSTQNIRPEKDETENSPEVIISTNIFVAADPWRHKKHKNKYRSIYPVTATPVCGQTRVSWKVTKRKCRNRLLPSLISDFNDLYWPLLVFNVFENLMKLTRSSHSIYRQNATEATWYVRVHNSAVPCSSVLWRIPHTFQIRIGNCRLCRLPLHQRLYWMSNSSQRRDGDVFVYMPFMSHQLQLQLCITTSM